VIQHPAIIALLTASFLTCLLLLHAARTGVQILWKWDPLSGSELQLALERRTYLVSTILGYTLAFQIVSLFLYIFTADRLHGLFVGAMCAAGSLNANGFGYPTLLLKIVNCFLAATWLTINHADTRGYDYPLVRVKYALLLALVPLALLEGFMQYSYFAGLKADVITSCCGSLFSVDKRNITGEIAALPAGPMEIAFYGGMAATMASGILFWWKGKGGYLFSAVSALTFVIAGASLVSFICLYFYELPTHHCPFCILQKEYGHVGYILYASLLGGGMSGVGAGALMPFRKRDSLFLVVPRIQRGLTAATLLLYMLFALIVSWRMLSTSFRLGG
jgi:hypothetical protein